MGIIVSDNILVALDTRINHDEYEKIVKNVEAQGVFYSTLTKNTVGDISGLLQINIDEYEPVNADDSIIFDSDINDMAMIMFTSGSTGKSKGVCLSQKNLISDACCTAEHALINPDECCNIICLPMFHIFCFAIDVMWLFVKGCAIAINSSIIRIKDEIKEFNASRVCMVPMMAEILLNELNTFYNNHSELTKSRVRQMVLGEKFHRIILGGAFVEQTLRDNLASYDMEVICGYGMTEATAAISSEEGSGARKGSIGEILNCNEVRIIDGEICARGDNIMMGYYKDEEATKEILSDGWLRTGDLGYIKDNYLYITGKKKNLIITGNGENVSPEELEGYLYESPVVKEVVCYQKNNQIRALIYPDYQGNKKLKKDEIKEKLEGFIQNMNRKMPMHKHIQAFDITDKELEKTSNMKIKREKYYY